MNWLTKNSDYPFQDCLLPQHGVIFGFKGKKHAPVAAFLAHFSSRKATIIKENSIGLKGIKSFFFFSY
jgi:hypothetical protein